ncbi:unnamed protein product [Symbiodinium necroappetens]|uniref:Uncharacterized protein n=1 Tax=Symbiodinium necroappetens TaxID=1628268 RepID=A0A812M619_9DINO|nr:unnamed protein product [Symbiodinium necroappetens]
MKGGSPGPWLCWLSFGFASVADWPTYLEGPGNQIPSYFNFDCVGLTQTFQWDLLHLSWENQDNGTLVWWQFEDAWRMQGRVGAERVLWEAETECPIGVLHLLLLETMSLMDMHEEAAGRVESVELPSGEYLEALYGPDSFDQSPVDAAQLCFLREHFQDLLGRVSWYLVALSRWQVFEVMYRHFALLVSRWRALKAHCMLGWETKATSCCSADNQQEDPVAWPELREAMLTFVAGLGPEKSLPAETQLSTLGNLVLGRPSGEFELLKQECPCGVLSASQYLAYASIFQYTRRFEDVAALIQELLVFTPLEHFGDPADWPVIQMFRIIADVGVGRFIQYDQYSKRKGRFTDLSPEVKAALNPFGSSDEARRFVPFFHRTLT